MFLEKMFQPHQEMEASTTPLPYRTLSAIASSVPLPSCYHFRSVYFEGEDAAGSNPKESQLDSDHGVCTISTQLVYMYIHSKFTGHYIDNIDTQCMITTGEKCTNGLLNIAME